MTSTMATPLSGKAKAIETFVFFDLEATGLHSPGARPRIVELSMVATHRSQLLRPCRNDEPRVLNKLTLCVYPMKPMEAVASTITGLYNDVLLSQKDLDENFVTSIQLFLARLLPPVCLVAHNGNNYDFGMMRSELGCLNRALPDDILCVDSLVLWRDLDSREPSALITEEKISRKCLDFRKDDPCLSVNGVGPSGAVMKNGQILQATPCKPTANRNYSFANPTAKSSGDNIPCDSTSAVSDQVCTGDLRNGNKKQKTFHRRRLFTEDRVPSRPSTDFNCNDMPITQVTSTGSPEGLPLLEDPFVSGNSGNELNTQKSIDKICITNCNKHDKLNLRRRNADKCAIESDTKESDSESDSDTIPVIGDTESETMSTLQAMSTFRYSASSQVSLSSRFPSFASGRQQSVSSIDDSQKTEPYSVMDDSMPTDSSQTESVSILMQRSAPFLSSQETVTDGEMLQLEMNHSSQKADASTAKAEIVTCNEPLNDLCQSQENFESSQVQLGSQNTLETYDISDSILGQMTLPSQTECPSDNTPNLNEGINIDSPELKAQNHSTTDLTRRIETDKSPSSRSQGSSPPPKSPENRPVPLEMLQDIHKLGTHAPKKKKKPPPKLCYKLAALHQRILGYEPPESHTAEDDSRALLRIFHRRAADVLPWCDDHAVPFNTIPLMYPTQQREALPDGVFPKDI